MDLEMLVQIISPIAGGGAGYLFARRKNKLENQSLETQNVGDNLELYQKMLDDLEKRYNKSLDAQRAHYDEKLTELKLSIEELKRELEECKRENTKK